MDALTASTSWPRFEFGLQKIPPRGKPDHMTETRLKEVNGPELINDIGCSFWWHTTSIAHFRTAVISQIISPSFTSG